MTLLFRMGQGACRYCFCLWRRPISHLWMFATNRRLGYPRCKAKNHWRSFEAHFQNGEVTVSFAILPIKAANRLVMQSSNRITCQLSYIKDHYSLTLRWCSFQCIVHSNVLPSIIAFILIWTYWLSFRRIETGPFGKAEPRNVLALVAPIILKFIHLAKWFILPAMLLLINQYSLATAQYSPIISL